VSSHVGLGAGSPSPQDGPAATVPRSPGASSRPGWGAASARPCQWAPCGRLFLPRATGGKPQKWCSPHCRELAKAAARAVCPHCGGSLGHGDIIKRERFAAGGKQ